jgi:uncharacterized protein YdaU (DUF1376 family)
MPPNRLPYFRFDVQSYLTDPAVLSMSAEAEGCYIRLLCRSWQSDTPGRVPIEIAEELAGVHRVDVDKRPRVMLEVARAFTMDGEVWVQKRMVAEFRRAIDELKRRKNGALVTNGKRWSKVAQRSLSDSSAVGNREVEVEVIDSKDKTLVAPDGAESVIPASKATPKATRVKKPEAEPPGFPAAYALFPRRDGRRAAAKAFSSALRRNPSYTSDDLLWAVGRFAERCRTEGREAQFTPMPATWLNQDRFREFFDETEDRHAETNGRPE